MGIIRSDLSDRPWIESIAVGAIGYVDVLYHVQYEIPADALHRPHLIEAEFADGELSPSEADLLCRLIRQLGTQGALGPIAIVAFGDLATAIRALRRQLGDALPIETFSDRESAEAWLTAIVPSRATPRSS